MNVQHWNDELEIFDKDSVMEFNETSILHLWQSEKDNVVFKIGEGFKLREDDDGYGNKIYVIEKVTKEHDRPNSNTNNE